MSKIFLPISYNHSLKDLGISIFPFPSIFFSFCLQKKKMLRKFELFLARALTLSGWGLMRIHWEE